MGGLRGNQEVRGEGWEGFKGLAELGFFILAGLGGRGKGVIRTWEKGVGVKRNGSARMLEA